MDLEARTNNRRRILNAPPLPKSVKMVSVNTFHRPPPVVCTPLAQGIEVPESGFTSRDNAKRLPFDGFLRLLTIQLVKIMATLALGEST